MSETKIEEGKAYAAKDRPNSPLHYLWRFERSDESRVLFWASWIGWTKNRSQVSLHLEPQLEWACGQSGYPFGGYADPPKEN